MIREDYQSKRRNPVALGVDAGASLTKLSLRRADGVLAHRLLPSADADGVLAAVQQSGARHVGLTGAGASPLAERLDAGAARVNEFAAWGAGARALLAEADGRHLIVSLGTGTSVMLLDGMSVTRVGGTALGGGTLLGLGALLLGTRSFEELVALSRAGDRRRVDLLVSDIYRAGEIPLAGDLTAASFGKLGRAGAAPDGVRREDLAQAVVALVGENVALICAGLANASQVTRVVFAGSSLRDNPVLRDTLHLVTSALGREATFLADGEFAAALGALLLASEPA